MECLATRRGLALGLAVLAMLLLAAGACAASPSSEGCLQAGDWQYQELDALARAGLLAGHPKGPISDWTSRLTRFEAASLTLRAIEGLGEAYRDQGTSLIQIAQAEEATEAADSAAPSAPRGRPLARIAKLIAEFRAELVAMGVRVDDLETAIKDAESRLAAVEAERKQHKLDGYVQFRYRDDNAPDGKQEFLVRRARFNIRGPVSERVSYRLELQLDAKESGKGTGSKAQLRTAYADYKLDQARLRVGQAKLPWGYELLASVPALWSGERSFFMDRLFPNQRDIGVQVQYRRSPEAPQVDVGVFNGTGINASDNNGRKNVMARVDFPLPGGSVALSGYNGTNGADAGATRQDRYGLSARYAAHGTDFMGEFVTGEDLGHDVRGWYAQVGHPLTRSRPNLLFVKYDVYDENRDLADNLFKRWTVGYWWELDKATRLTVVAERRRPEPGFSELSKWGGNAAYVQMQVKY